ncbi:MAG: hypothetical protein ACD_49C00044G0022 [uncultured bacterium (gcode 4)]|uniref:Polymerase/histidinol phosphatase N-terminal domain-containing protein n=1 Tax=uncultured bacterium (gcode 4) TaxID=1234023 RepID=K2AEE0_9BACT|nr:MAG: hypothetical protein ACD_49C00044G0022 [uncultured bacterium (gcode 4)]
MKTDCHFHTNLSDWKFDNAQVIAQAKEKWVKFAICTDHDIVNSEFPHLARTSWILSYEWVEASCFDEKNNHHLHFTTYSKKFNGKVTRILEKTRDWKKIKISSQIALLQKNWFRVEIKEFYDFYSTKTNIDNLNSYHLASYILRFPENLELIKKLTWENLNIEQFLLRCLKIEWDLKHIWAVEIEWYEPTIAEFWQVAKQENYIFSLAHPNFKMTQEKFRQRIEYYLNLWVNAVEINVQAEKSRVELILKFQKKYDFLLTFWSDCHFKTNKWEKHWGFWDINPYVSQELVNLNLENLKKKLELN